MKRPLAMRLVTAPRERFPLVTSSRWHNLRAGAWLHLLAFPALGVRRLCPGFVARSSVRHPTGRFLAPTATHCLGMQAAVAITLNEPPLWSNPAARSRSREWLLSALSGST